jgi:beta-lactamase class A
MSRIRRPWSQASTMLLVGVLSLAVALAVLFVTPAGRVDAGDAVVSATVSSPTATTTSSPTAATAEPSTAATAEPSTAVLAAQEVAVANDHLSVAVLDPETGRTAEANGDSEYVSASIAKVDILAALLLKAQDEGRDLTAAERTSASAMIRQSDNDAATTLWKEVGGAAGLEAANVRLGLTETTPSAESWGLTTTTVGDQVELLVALTEEASALDADSRAYAVGLMESVTTDQAWGVSAAADEGTTALKNGWLPRTATGLWVVNSIGRITHDGHELLVAILSDSHTSMDAGVAEVETAAQTAAEAVSQ